MQYMMQWKSHWTLHQWGKYRKCQDGTTGDICVHGKLDGSLQSQNVLMPSHALLLKSITPACTLNNYYQAGITHIYCAGTTTYKIS